MLINIRVIKYVTETLILVLLVEICDIRVLISYLDQILGKRQLSNSAGIQFCGIQFRDFLVLKLFASTKFCENGQKSQISRNLVLVKFNTFKVIHFRVSVLLINDHSAGLVFLKN